MGGRHTASRIRVEHETISRRQTDEPCLYIGAAAPPTHETCGSLPTISSSLFYSAARLSPPQNPRRSGWLVERPWRSWCSTARAEPERKPRHGARAAARSPTKPELGRRQLAVRLLLAACLAAPVLCICLQRHQGRTRRPPLSRLASGVGEAANMEPRLQPRGNGRRRCLRPSRAQTPKPETSKRPGMAQPQETSAGPRSSSAGRYGGHHGSPYWWLRH
ncbi:hypothetical protein HU200_020907 [Digitaria exilis]|uniref:Uncharacterized protein n=1 Tax=Digitaria exilis TaxID=1010633 RepID=A0A835F0M8_9POAL|nr:hypothetical protein HU200_020907 [Digitaria exilis]CAB3472466.1 unnamed protein product [Digitaria exilis]